MVMNHFRPIRLLVPVVLLLGACAGADSAVENAPPPSTTLLAPVAEEPDSDPCDVGPKGEAVDCAAENLVVEESVDGAIERVQQEQTWDSDLQFLMLDEAAYTSYVKPSLGPAELVPGGAMPVYGFYGPALAGRGEPLSWQQEWSLESGATIVEQVVLLEDSVAAKEAFAAWKASAIASGLSDLEFEDSAPGAFDVFYSDPSSAYPNRTCAVQSIVAVSRFLVSVTYLTGGDCRVTPAPVASSILAGIAARIEKVFPG